MRKLVIPGLALCAAASMMTILSGQQAPPQAAAPQPAPLPPLVAVRPISPPAKPLPGEAESAGVTRFSFVAYGDTRSGSDPNVPGDGQIIHPVHTVLADQIVAKAKELASTPFPLRFVVQSGDAVLRGANGAMWNISFTPIIEKLSAANIPYFFTVGNHDVTGMPAGDRSRALSLHNTLTAMSKLIPPEGSPRRLNGYPTYAFGYGNAFFIMLDSNIAADPLQLAWVGDQLEHVDRGRYTHIIAAFHHPPFSSGQHGGPTLEPTSAAIRDHYMPLFRKHHVRMIVAGHDHLLDHWVEHYTDPDGKTYRLDAVITGGGGAPQYAYTSEPDLTSYLASNAAQKVRVDHLTHPGPAPENLHHFLVVQVDGPRLSVEVVALGGAPYAPYGGKAGISLDDH